MSVAEEKWSTSIKSGRKGGSNRCNPTLVRAGIAINYRSTIESSTVANASQEINGAFLSFLVGNGRGSEKKGETVRRMTSFISWWWQRLVCICFCIEGLVVHWKKKETNRAGNEGWKGNRERKKPIREKKALLLMRWCTPRSSDYAGETQKNRKANRLVSLGPWTRKTRRKRRRRRSKKVNRHTTTRSGELSLFVLFLCLSVCLIVFFSRISGDCKKTKLWKTRYPQSEIGVKKPSSKTLEKLVQTQ